MAILYIFISSGGTPATKNSALYHEILSRSFEPKVFFFYKFPKFLFGLIMQDFLFDIFVEVTCLVALMIKTHQEIKSGIGKGIVIYYWVGWGNQSLIWLHAHK